jgi:hypothetical protein
LGDICTPICLLILSLSLSLIQFVH